MSEKTTDLQKEIERLKAELAAKKAAAQAVRPRLDGGALLVEIDLPDQPIGVTKSGNARFVEQHYRYFKIPGSPLKVKVDVIRPTKDNKE